MVSLKIINRLNVYLLVDLTPTKAILEVTLNRLKLYLLADLTPTKAILKVTPNKLIIL